MAVVKQIARVDKTSQSQSTGRSSGTAASSKLSDQTSLSPVAGSNSSSLPSNPIAAISMLIEELLNRDPQLLQKLSGTQPAASSASTLSGTPASQVSSFSQFLPTQPPVVSSRGVSSMSLPATGLGRNSVPATSTPNLNSLFSGTSSINDLYKSILSQRPPQMTGSGGNGMNGMNQQNGTNPMNQNQNNGMMYPGMYGDGAATSMQGLGRAINLTTADGKQLSLVANSNTLIDKNGNYYTYDPATKRIYDNATGKDSGIDPSQLSFKQNDGSTIRFNPNAGGEGQFYADKDGSKTFNAGDPVAMPNANGGFNVAGQGNPAAPAAANPAVADSAASIPFKTPDGQTLFYRPGDDTLRGADGKVANQIYTVDGTTGQLMNSDGKTPATDKDGNPLNLNFSDFTNKDGIAWDSTKGWFKDSNGDGNLDQGEKLMTIGNDGKFHYDDGINVASSDAANPSLDSTGATSSPNLLAMQDSGAAMNPGVMDAGMADMSFG